VDTIFKHNRAGFKVPRPDAYSRCSRWCLLKGARNNSTVIDLFVGAGGIFLLLAQYRSRQVRQLAVSPVKLLYRQPDHYIVDGFTTEV
jgi:hypothetical protein